MIADPLEHDSVEGVTRLRIKLHTRIVGEEHNKKFNKFCNQ